MTAWQALILGLVQGVTEFLPVSSSGHLALFQYWFNFQESLLFFDVFLHAASLIAIGWFFWPHIKQLKLKDYWLLIVGTLPAVGVGLLFQDTIEAFFSLPLLVGLALIITGLINAQSQRLLKSLPKEPIPLNEKKAFVIGFFQSLALTPGISRSGTTLFGSFSQKLNKEQAFTFTFLLGIPAILGANLFQVIQVSAMVRAIIKMVQNHFQNKLKSFDFQRSGSPKGPTIANQIKMLHHFKYHLVSPVLRGGVL